MKLQNQDKKYIWHPYTQALLAPNNIPIVKAKGCKLWDEDGKEYIDAIASWWVNVHGHCNDYITEKVYKQLHNLDHIIFAGFTHPQAIELSERLIKLLPDNQQKIFFSDNGSTSVEVAIKMTIQFWSNQGLKKNKIVVLENSYHGDTFGAMSLGERSPFSAPFHELLFDVETIPVPTDENIKEVITLLDKLGQSGEVAGFIFEPLVLGTAGMQMYRPEHLDQLIQTAQENKLLVIADEVMTGFGRTGKMLACDYLQYKPDIFCLSKGITGGILPLGINSCTEEIYQAFLSEDKYKTFFHGHSYTGNAIACSAALASLDIFEQAETWSQITWIQKSHQVFAKVLASYAFIQNIRQQGTILAFDIVKEGKTGYFNSVRDKLYDFYIKEGVLLRPLGNVVYILPPYSISKEELEKVYQVILDSFEIV